MTRWNWVTIGCCCVTMLALWWFTPEIISCLGFSATSTQGQFGDQFGFYNALASSLTIILLAVATIYQHRQFETQQREYQELYAAERIRADQDFRRMEMQAEMINEQKQANRIALLHLRVKNEREFLTYHKAESHANPDEIEDAKKNLDKFEKQIKDEFNRVFVA